MDRTLSISCEIVDWIRDPDPIFFQLQDPTETDRIRNTGKSDQFVGVILTNIFHGLIQKKLRAWSKISQVKTGRKDYVPFEKLDGLCELVLQLCVANVLAGLNHLSQQLLQQTHRPNYAPLNQWLNQLKQFMPRDGNPQ